MTYLVVAAAIFTFQNNFWVNLHQFLHAEASRKAAGRAIQLDAELVEGYAEMARRDLLRDERLAAINDALSRVEGDTLPATIDPAAAAALTRAAPAYRARFWPQHRQSNDAWISAMKPLVDRHGPALTAALAKAYHTPWPDMPILVDVAIEAGPFGGYTTDVASGVYAAHSTISPVGQGSAGELGVETIFHEASHAVDAAIMRMIADESRRQQRQTPRNLWHAVIFYTTGELVRRALGRGDDAHYMPYAYRFNVYEKGMLPDRAALERDWQPWLDGKVPFEEALRNLVRDVAR
jgi:hypothetical protein